MLLRLMVVVLLLTSGLDVRAQPSELKIDPNPASTLEPVEVLVAFPRCFEPTKSCARTELIRGCYSISALICATADRPSADSA